VPQRVKDRAEALRLSAHGWDVEKIAAYLNWAPQTVRETIHRWNSFGLGGLWEAPGRGGKTRWQEADIAYLEQCLEQEPRTYNSQQLAQKLSSRSPSKTESRTAIKREAQLHRFLPPGSEGYSKKGVDLEADSSEL